MKIRLSNLPCHPCQISIFSNVFTSFCCDVCVFMYLFIFLPLDKARAIESTFSDPIHNAAYNTLKGSEYSNYTFKSGEMKIPNAIKFVQKQKEEVYNERSVDGMLIKVLLNSHSVGLVRCHLQSLIGG